MKKKIEIFVFTFARSDLGIMTNLLKKIKKDERFNLNLVVNSVHLNREFGFSHKEIEKDMYDKIFFVRYRVTNDTIKNISNMIKSYNAFFKLKKIGICLILGDRFEAMSVSIICKNYLKNIIHLCGGSETEGSLDNIYRYCISKMSSLHFVETENHKKNLNNVGITKNIYVSGSLSLEGSKKKLISKIEFEKKFNIKFLKSKSIICACFHPETTLTTMKNLENFKIMIKFLKNINHNVVLTYPNADLNYQLYINEIKKLKNYKNFFIFKTLGKTNYFSLLKFSDYYIGNSSSGIIETFNFSLPSLNLGNRQKNRTCNKNTIHSSFKYKEIEKNFKLLKHANFKKSFIRTKDCYYKKNSSDIIVKEIVKYLKKKS